MQGTVRTRRAGNRGCPRPLRGAAAPPAALARVAVVLWVTTLAVWWRVLTGGSLNPLDGPRLSPDAMVWLPALLIIVVIAVAMLLPMVGQGRSPHLTWRPEQIDVGLDDVQGLGPLREEVTKTLNLFLGYATCKDRLGGNLRRGSLFEGKAARQVGGAIGFIEEIDAIGGRRRPGRRRRRPRLQRHRRGRQRAAGLPGHRLHRHGRGLVSGHGGGPERAQRGRQGAVGRRRPGPHRLHRRWSRPLRDALLEREELIGAEILEVLTEAEAGLSVPCRPGAPRPARPPATTAGRAGRSGAGRVGSPRR